MAAKVTARPLPEMSAGQVWYLFDNNPVLTCGLELGVAGKKLVNYLPVQCEPKHYYKNDEATYIRQNSMAELMKMLKLKKVQVQMGQKDFEKRYKYRSVGPRIGQVWEEMDKSDYEDGKKIFFVNTAKGTSEVEVKGFHYVKDQNKHSYRLFVDLYDLNTEQRSSMLVMRFKNAYQCKPVNLRYV